jgi:rubrerythrin
MSTDANLKAAFAGESQANRMYLAFAKKADQEGFKQVARLFRAAAAAETIHAHAHFRVMNGVKSTLDNLKTAKGGEEHEYKSMYPGFVAEAEQEGNKAALISFKNAMAVEEIHAGMYGDALDAINAGKDLPGTAVYVCEICGNTVYGEAPEKCPICGVPKERFMLVE